MTKIKIAFLTFLVSILYSIHTIQAQNSALIDKIIAKIDNQIILKSDLESQYLQYIAQGGEASSDTKCKLLETLIVNKMLLAKAAIDSIRVEDKIIDSELNRRMEYFIAQYGSKEKLEKFHNKTVTQLKNTFRPYIKDELLIQQMQAKITENLAVSPSEVKKYFNQIKDTLSYFDAEAEIAQIVKLPTISKAQKKITIDKLQKLKERVQAGEDFGTLAKEYSEDKATAVSGGELGYFKRGELVPSYEAESYRLKVGELSNIIESEFGFHLIQLLDRRGNEYNTRHILLRAASSEIDLEETKEYLDSLRLAILDKKITFEKAAKEYSYDKPTAMNGGFFVEQNNNTSVPIANLDFVIYSTIDTMQVGTISRPIPYRTEDNKDAVRILYYKSKTAPHEPNLKQDYQKFYNLTLNKKRAERINEWFDKNKGELFIEIDPDYKSCDLLHGK